MSRLRIGGRTPLGTRHAALADIASRRAPVATYYTEASAGNMTSPCTLPDPPCKMHGGRDAVPPALRRKMNESKSLDRSRRCQAGGTSFASMDVGVPAPADSHP